MEVEFAFLADAAVIPPDGKLYVHGGSLQVLHASTFPATQSFALVLNLKLHPTEAGRRHRLEIQLWDKEGKRLVPELSGELNAQASEQFPTRPLYVPLVLNYAPLVLPAPGDYEFHIIVNNQHLKTLPLYVVQRVVPLAPPTA